MMDYVLNQITAILQNILSADLTDLHVGFWDTLGEVQKAPEAIDAYMLKALREDLPQLGMALSGSLTGVARALGAIFALCIGAKMAYDNMLLQEKFDVLKIMRPLIFAFMLTFWQPVCTALMAPGRALESYMKTRYETVSSNMENKRSERSSKALKVSGMLMEKVVAGKQVEEAANDKDNGFFVRLWDGITGIGEDISERINSFLGSIQILVTTWIYHGIETVIMWIGQVCFAVAVYIVFMLKALLQTVLCMFGPVYVVCSVLGIWKDSWSQWVGRMVTVSLYGAMAYLVMTFAVMFINYGLDADIKKLQAIIEAGASQGVAAYVLGGLGTTVLTATGYFVGCVAMSAVPEMASMCFPSQAVMGASSFIGGMSSYALKYSGTQSVLGSR